MAGNAQKKFKPKVKFIELFSRESHFRELVINLLYGVRMSSGLRVSLMRGNVLRISLTHIEYFTEFVKFFQATDFSELISSISLRIREILGNREKSVAGLTIPSLQ